MRMGDDGRGRVLGVGNAGLVGGDGALVLGSGADVASCGCEGTGGADKWCVF